jgi:hypothetical protein
VSWSFLKRFGPGAQRGDAGPGTPPSNPSSKPTEAPQSTRTLRSPALAALFDALESADPATPAKGSQLLDLGPALGNNIEILGQRTSGLRIADLYRSLARGRGTGAPEVVTADTLDDLAPYREDRDGAGPVHLRRGYHAVLAWDVVAYLEPHELEALVARLARWVRPGGVVHAIVYHGKSMPAEPRQFRIVGLGSGTGPYRGTLGELHYSQGTSSVPSPDLPPARIEKLFEPFRMEKSFLLQDGAREYLFVREE